MLSAVPFKRLSRVDSFNLFLSLYLLCAAPNHFIQSADCFFSSTIPRMLSHLHFEPQSICSTVAKDYLLQLLVRSDCKQAEVVHSKTWNRLSFEIKPATSATADEKLSFSSDVRTTKYTTLCIKKRDNFTALLYNNANLIISVSAHPLHYIYIALQFHLIFQTHLYPHPP